jgi:hypothetical protein
MTQSFDRYCLTRSSSPASSVFDQLKSLGEIVLVDPNQVNSRHKLFAKLKALTGRAGYLIYDPSGQVHHRNIQLCTADPPCIFKVNAVEVGLGKQVILSSRAMVSVTMLRW